MLNEKQYEQLLKPLNPNRVAKRKGGGGKQLSYLEAWEVKAHLTRIFGFLNWEWEVTEAALAFEESADSKWNVGYKVLGSLTIKNTDDGFRNCVYSEAAVGFATLSSRGEAHDMAIKTAESDALKRAAINLGTQFGLSLYDNGSTKDVIGRTLDRETEHGDPVTDMSEAPVIDIPTDSEGVEVWINKMKEAVTANDVPLLLEIKKEMKDQEVLEYLYQGGTLAKWHDKAVVSAGKVSA